MPITHAFTSAKSDPADSTLVKPSDWNADHDTTGLNLLIDGGVLVQQANTGANNTSPRNAVLAGAPTEGNVIYLLSGISSNADITPTQTNVTWSRLLEVTNGTSAEVALWKGVVGASASATISCTRASGSAYWAAWAAEFSGTDGTLVTSGSNTWSGQSIHTTPSVNPGSGCVLFYAMVSNSGSSGSTSISNFTLGFGSNFIALGYRLASADNDPIAGIGWNTVTTASAALTAAIT